MYIYVVYICIIKHLFSSIVASFCTRVQFDKEVALCFSP